MPFTFSMADRISLSFTVLFLFSLLLYTFCFFLLVPKYLKRKAGYFVEFTYRENAGYCYKIVSLLLRNLLRAAVFCFLHYQFKFQLHLLSLVEIFIIIFTIIIQSLYKTIMSRAVYVINLSYSFLIILLNLTLLFEDS